MSTDNILMKPVVENPIDDYVMCSYNMTPIGKVRIWRQFNLNAANLNGFE